ncbi:MAG: YfcE family phosphodiesterase [Armatimonadetes bacterium]|nr:YfcE family phosphodiesterase [Armatimonadota bacterium]
MKLGVFSDPHGRRDNVASALELLRERAAEVFVCCGDVGSESVLEALAGEEVYLVFGNVDEEDRSRLTDYARNLRINLPVPGELFILGGRRVAVWHGHEKEKVESRLVGEQACDYLFCGHTHQRRDERLGGVRIINPGALQRAREKTVALVDLATDDAEFLSLSE